jgi:tetratricopeptide (TPR) repeat protein
LENIEINDKISLLQANELRELRETRDNQRKNLRKAIEIYEQLIVQIGKEPDLLSILSMCYFRLASLEDNSDRYHKAISIINLAIELIPEDPSLHAILASYYELGTSEYDKASNEYQKALELSPYDVQTLNSIVRLHRYPEVPTDFEEMHDWLERLIKLEPDEPRHHAFLAEQYYHMGRIKDAQKEAIKSLTCIKPLQGLTDQIKSILNAKTKSVNDE